MEHIFYTPCKEGRPVRLSPATRRFAKESLDGQYGRALADSPFLSVDDIENFAELSPLAQYDAAIRRIATEAPLRFCPSELLCGSASLGDAIRHVVPVRYKNQPVFSSVSHVTLGFDKALRLGLYAYLEQLTARIKTAADEREREFLLSLANVFDALRIWHGRYIQALEQLLQSAADPDEKKYYSELLENLRPVPFQKPKTFRQALQALWFLFAFTRLCGNWPGIGRLDVMLGCFLEADLREKRIAPEEARELLAHFFIKGCEWITLGSNGSGDAQHYQNIVLGGSDEKGNDISNSVTYLVLDIIEELPIGDFPIAVRVHANTPPQLLERIGQVIRHGGGIVAVYNEKLILESMAEFGYDPQEALHFANDGCWEVQLSGQTCFTYAALDGFGLLQREVLHIDAPGTETDFPDFESLYAAYGEKLAALISRFHDQADTWGTHALPCSVVSFFTDDCIERARGYFDRGARYTVLSPHLGGIPDAANSLYAIKKLVYEEKKLTLPQLIACLQNNWEGNEPLRRYAQNNYTYYGNDNDEADALAARITADFIGEVRKIKERNGVLRPAGISTFGRQIEWRHHGAAAHGFLDGDILAGNLSPTPGTDLAGATAIIRSHCKCDLSRLTCGTALDIKLDPSCIQGQEGTRAIVRLIQGFVALGGFFMQIDAVDNSVLLEAQKHPKRYQSLAVRISGWSARFVTLNEEWQKMIIERSCQRN